MSQSQPPILVDGRYRVESVLGRSERSITMLATRVDLDQTVVLKILKNQPGTNPALAKRFAREIKATANIQHPNVIALYDAKTMDDGRAYFAMEYVPGRTLKDVLALEAPLDPMRAAHLIRQICAGVAAAHTAGIAHRDLNPQNIVISNRQGKPDFVTVMHFAVAKVIGADPATRLTMAGAVLGDASYSPPEMADPMFKCPEGYHEAESGDIYSIGCMAFEMLVGRPPLTHGSIMRQFMLRMRSKPDWPEEAASIPAPIREAVDAMLEPDITLRPQTGVAALRIWSALAPDASRRSSSSRDVRRVVPTTPPARTGTPTPASRMATTPLPRTMTPVGIQTQHDQEVGIRRPLGQSDWNRSDVSPFGLQQVSTASAALIRLATPPRVTAATPAPPFTVRRPTHPPQPVAERRPTHPPQPAASRRPTHPPQPVAERRPTHPPQPAAPRRPTHPPQHAVAPRPTPQPTVVVERRPTHPPQPAAKPRPTRPPQAAAAPRTPAPPRPAAPRRPSASPRPAAPARPSASAAASRPPTRRTTVGRGLLMLGADKSVMVLVRELSGARMVASVLARLAIQEGQQLTMNFPGPNGGRIVRGVASAVRQGMRGVDVALDLSPDGVALLGDMVR